MEVKRGDIVRVNFSGALFSEQGEERPAIIIQNNVGNKYAPTTIVVPLTSQLKKVKQPTHAVIRLSEATGLTRTSMTLCEQVRTIDKKRIIEKVGHVNEEAMKRVLTAYIANAFCDEDEEVESGVV